MARDRWDILAAKIAVKRRARPPTKLGEAIAAEADVMARAGTVPGQAMAAWAEMDPGWLGSVRHITFARGVLHVRFEDAAAHHMAFRDLRSGPAFEAAQRATKFQVKRIRTSL